MSTLEEATHTRDEVKTGFGSLYSDKPDLNEGRLLKTFEERKAWSAKFQWRPIEKVSYSEEQGQVTVYFTVPHVHELPENQVVVWFTDVSLEVRVLGNGENWSYIAQELWSHIDTAKCSWKQKTPKVQRQKMDGEVLFAVQPEQYYSQFLDKEIRPDGRGLSEARIPQGRVNVITRSDGSASVSLGSTMAVCATRGEIRTHDEVDASRGRVTISVTVSPGCGMHVRDGDALSFDLTPRIQKLIDDPKVIDLASLVIKENESSWEINVDIVLISLDGNAMDAAMLCALLALRTTTLPALDLSTEKGKTRYEISTAPKPTVEARRVTLRRLPITVSLGRLDSKWVVDPTLVEENILESHASLTFVNGQYNWEQRGVCRDAPIKLASTVSATWTKWLESF